MSVSVTTRAQRPGEIDGQHYHFIDKARFDEMVKQNELLEWATVFGNSYGTPRKPVEATLKAGRDMLFDLDWQGTQQMRERARDDLVSVFILPRRRPNSNSGCIRARRTTMRPSAAAWPRRATR